MHGAQRRRRIRQDQNLAEIFPQVRTGREPLLDSRERCLDRIFGFSRQFEIVPGNKFKQTEHDFRIFNGSDQGQGHAPVHNGKFRRSNTADLRIPKRRDQTDLASGTSSNRTVSL